MLKLLPLRLLRKLRRKQRPKKPKTRKLHVRQRRTTDSQHAKLLKLQNRGNS
jgi:hypothetical protein